MYVSYINALIRQVPENKIQNINKTRNFFKLSLNFPLSLNSIKIRVSAAGPLSLSRSLAQCTFINLTETIRRLPRKSDTKRKGNPLKERS